MIPKSVIFAHSLTWLGLDMALFDLSRFSVDENPKKEFEFVFILPLDRTCSRTRAGPRGLC